MLPQCLILMVSRCQEWRLAQIIQFILLSDQFIAVVGCVRSLPHLSLASVRCASDQIEHAGMTQSEAYRLVWASASQVEHMEHSMGIWSRDRWW